MSNKSEAVSTIFAVLKAIDRNNAMSTMICDYLISSDEEKKLLREGTKTFIDRCKLEIDQLKKQFRSKTFSSFDQLNKLLADLLYQNHDLRQKVLGIKADIVYTENRDATKGIATCPVDVIYGDFPDLLKKQQTGSQPLTVLCDVLMDRYNLYSEPLVNKALAKLETALRTKLEKKGGKSTPNNPVSNTGPSQDKEKTSTRMTTTSILGNTVSEPIADYKVTFVKEAKKPNLTTSVTTGVTRKALESDKGGPFCNMVSEPIASTSADYKVTVVKKMTKPKLTTTVRTNVSRRLKPIKQIGDPTLTALTVIPVDSKVIATKESKRLKPLTPPCDQVMEPLTVTAADKPIIPTYKSKRLKRITSPCDQVIEPLTVTAADKPIIPTYKSKRLKRITSPCDQVMEPLTVTAADKPIIPTYKSKRLKRITSPCDQVMEPLTVTAADKPIIPTYKSKRLKRITLPCDQVMEPLTVTAADEPITPPSDKVSTPLTVTPVDRMVIPAKGPKKLKPNTSVASRIITESGTAGNNTPTDPVSMPQTLSQADSKFSVAKESSMLKHVTLGVISEPHTLINTTPAVDLISAPVTTSAAEFKVPAVKDIRRLNPTTSVNGSKISTIVTSNNSSAVDQIATPFTIRPAKFKVPVVKENRLRLAPTTSVSAGATTGSQKSAIVMANNTPAVDLVAALSTISPAEFKVPVVKENRRLVPATSVSVGATTGSKTSTVVTSNNTPPVDLVAALSTISPAKFKVPVVKENRRLVPSTSVSVGATTEFKTSTIVTSNNTPAVDRISAPFTISPAKFKVPVVKEKRRLPPTTSVSVEATTGSETSTIVTSNNTPAVDLVAAPVTISPAKFMVPEVKENRGLRPTTFISPTSTNITSINATAVDRISVPFTIRPAKFKVPVVKEIRAQEIKHVYRPPLTFDLLPLKVIVSKFTSTLPQGYLCTLRETMKKRQGVSLEQSPAQWNTQKVGRLTGKTSASSRPDSPDIPPAEQRLTNTCKVCPDSATTSSQTTGQLAGRKRRAKGWKFSSIPPAKRPCLSTGLSVQSVPRPRRLAGRKRSAESLDSLSVPPAKRRKTAVPPQGIWSFECGGWTYRKRSC